MGFANLFPHTANHTCNVNLEIKTPAALPWSLSDSARPRNRSESRSLCFRYFTRRRVWRRCCRTWPSWCLWRRGPHNRVWPKWSQPCCKRWTTLGGDPSSRPPAPPDSWSSTPAGRDTTLDRQLGNDICGDHGHMQVMQSVIEASKIDSNACHGEPVAKGNDNTH